MWLVSTTDTCYRSIQDLVIRNVPFVVEGVFHVFSTYKRRQFLILNPNQHTFSLCYVVFVFEEGRRLKNTTTSLILHFYENAIAQSSSMSAIYN